MQHPGPWKFDYDWGRLPSIYGADGNRVAIVEKDKVVAGGLTFELPEREANAWLIAAAPKLLAAVGALIPAATIAAEMLSAVGKTDEATAIFKAIDLAYQFQRDAGVWS